MEDQNNAAVAASEPTEEQASVLDFDPPSSPPAGGEQSITQEAGDADVGAAPAGEEPAEQRAPDDDPEISLRDNTKVKLSELKRSYRPDWEKQVQTFAQQQKQFAQATQGFTQAQQQSAAVLQSAVAFVQSRMPKAPDLALLESDPFEYQKQKAHYDAQQGELHQLRAMQAHQYQQAVQQQRQAMQRRVLQEREATLRLLPDLKDPVRATKFAEEVKTLGTELGFSTAEMNDIRDHRILRLISKALKADQYEKASAAAKAKLKEVQKPPVEVQAPQRRRSSAQVQSDTLRARLETLRKNPNSAKAAEDVLSRFD